MQTPVPTRPPNAPKWPLGYKGYPDYCASTWARPRGLKDALYGSKKEASYIEERKTEVLQGTAGVRERTTGLLPPLGVRTEPPASGDYVMRRS